jgi:ATP-dependent helicase/nuclease subunit B
LRRPKTVCSVVPDRIRPRVYSIAAHRGFADALVAGLLPRYGDDNVGLARLTLLLPSRRAVRTVTEAFVRLSGNGAGGGLLLPRMVVVGDLDLDETLGVLLDPLAAGADIPPAADPVRRWLTLAGHLRDELGERAPRGPALLRQAFELGRVMDRLLVEGIGPEELLDERVIAAVSDQAEHWKNAVRNFARVQARWLADLTLKGEVDAPARRNLLFDHAAQSWKANPPAHPIVAAGVTSASPALARLLRVVSELPGGAVILPDLDLALDDGVWDRLGTAGSPPEPGDPPFGSGDAVTHPQYHLKLLLNRMGVARTEVDPWHRSGLSPAPPARSRAISNLFLPPEASVRWVRLKAEDRRPDPRGAGRTGAAGGVDHTRPRAGRAGDRASATLEHSGRRYSGPAAVADHGRAAFPAAGRGHCHPRRAGAADRVVGPSAGRPDRRRWWRGTGGLAGPRPAAGQGPARSPARTGAGPSRRRGGRTQAR